MSDETPEHCGQPMAYLELPEFYDGALFLVCQVCKGWKHRFPKGHYLRERAERAVVKHIDVTAQGELSDD